MTVILHLPDDLQEVPHDRHQWAAWRDRLRVHRIATRQRADRDPTLQAIERARCAASPAYWLAMYGWVFEQRDRITDLGEVGGNMPAIPYAFQVDLLEWIQARMAANKFEGRKDNDGVVSKARDSGFSWTFAAYVTHQWLFSDNFDALLLSYKEELVNGGTSKSLFWKILYLIGVNNRAPLSHPKWLTPRNFDPDRHVSDKDGIQNPENNNNIQGEATTKRAGRGGRFKMVLLDEYAFFPNGGIAWNLLRSSTDHRFAVSTENLEYGSHHRDLWQARKADPERAVSVYEFDWWMHPEHDQRWYDQELEEAILEGTEAEFHAEVDRDPFAAKSDWYYPLARDLTERTDENPNGQIGDFPYDPEGGDVACAIDPGTKDPTAILWLQHVPGTAFWNVIEAYDRDRMGVEYFGGVMLGELKSGMGLFPDGDAIDVMQLTARLRARGVTYYGDPDLAKKTFNDPDPALMKLRRMGIHVNLATAGGARNHPQRKEATNSVLPRLRWNVTSPRVKRALDAVQQSEYERKAEGGTGEATRPKHDRHSHYRSALEYFAVNLDRQSTTKQDKREPYRMVNGVKKPVRSTYRPGRLTTPAFHD